MEESYKNSKNKSNNTLGLILIILMVAALSSYLGYWTGSNKQNIVPIVSTGNSPVVTQSLGPRSIIQSQQATAMGEIVSKSPISIIVKGPDGNTATFNLSKSLTVFLPSATTSAKPSQTLTRVEDIQTNRKAIITLTLQGTDYLVTNIQYLPPEIK